MSADALDAYVQALLDGEVDDVDAWLEAHPEIDDALRADLELVGSLHRAAASVAEDSVFESGEPEQSPEPRHYLTPDTRLGEHVIVERLGAGGMGEVYRARHEVLDKDVAIKVLRSFLAEDPDAVARFRREVQAQASLAPHPNVVTATHASEHDGRLYLVMEYVPGTDLTRLVRSGGPLAPERAVALITQAARGLAHAHEASLVHRDVKPSNLLVTEDGVVKVVDLGLARLARSATDGDGRPTWVDELIGSLDYMAPEQANDPDDADARSDLYALGCTLYYLLAGRAPFADRLALKKLMAHAVDAPPPIEQPLPTGLQDVLLRLLAKDPADRFESADALVTALDALDLTPPSEAATRDERLVAKRPRRSAEPTPKPPPKRRGGPLWIAALVGALVLAAAGAALVLRRPARARLAEGQPVSGRLGDDDAVRPKDGAFFDTFRVPVEAGVTYAFTMRSQSVDPMLVLRTPEGWEIDTNDDAPGHGQMAQLLWRADRDEIELVATAPDAQLGAYTVAVERVELDGLAVDETASGALEASDATYADGSLLDRYWLSVEAGETYVLTMRGEGFVPFLFLATDDRRMIARGRPLEGEANTAQLVWVAAVSGAVFVGANAQEVDEGGAYRLTAASETAGVEVLNERGALSDGDDTLGDDSFYDAYPLVVRAGRTYVVTMQSDQLDTYLLLVDEDDTRLAQNDDAIGTNSRIVYRASEDQTLQVYANSFAAGMRGGYTLSVRELTD